MDRNTQERSRVFESVVLYAAHLMIWVPLLAFAAAFAYEYLSGMMLGLFCFLCGGLFFVEEHRLRDDLANANPPLPGQDLYSERSVDWTAGDTGLQLTEAANEASERSDNPAIGS